MKEFTEEKLAQYNGKNGNPVYIAYQGKVYDVSTSFLWKDGTHQVLHSTGVDLTDALEQAPHSRDILQKFPVVGILHRANTSDIQSKPSARARILWGITGSGDKLADTIVVMKKLQKKYDLNIKVALSKNAEKVVRMYDLWKQLKEGFKEVLVERGSNEPFLVGAIQMGKYDFFIGCPATANTTAKIAHGIADSLISNCVSQALKANQRVYIYPVDQKPSRTTTILPDGKELTLTMRKTDLANVERLKEMAGVTVLSSTLDIENVIRKQCAS